MSDWPRRGRVPHVPVLHVGIFCNPTFPQPVLFHRNNYCNSIIPCANMRHEFEIPTPSQPRSRFRTFQRPNLPTFQRSRKSFPCHSYEPSRNHHKTRHFKSISCHSYEQSPYKSFVCHSYEKDRGGTHLFPKWNPCPPTFEFRCPKPALSVPLCLCASVPLWQTLPAAMEMQT